MSSTPPPPPLSAAAHPLRSLGQQAQQRPSALALSWRQDGSWVTLSWSQLARRVVRAAQGWQALGVSADEGVLVMGAGDEAPVVSLLALLSLGAHLRASTPERLAQGLREARFALARDTQDVDRLLAHAPDSLAAIVVENEFGTEPSPRVKIIGWSDLLQAGPEGDTLALPPSDALALVTETGDSQPRGWSLAALSAAASSTAARSAVADFEPGWTPGVRWLLNDWLGTGAQLVLHGAGAPAGSQWPGSKADLWLASGAVLNEFAGRVRQRAGARGAAAWALRSPKDHPALAPVARLLRIRIRQALGLPRALQVLTDATASADALQLLQHLGARPRIEDGAVPAMAAVHSPAPPRPTPRSDRREALLSQVST